MISRVKIVLSVVVLFSLCLVASAAAKTITGQADFTAWSGYWWSVNGGALANGYGTWQEPAPLEKYEQYTLGRYPGDATNWELEHNFDPDAPSWFGLCHAWASAAVVENIDFVPAVVDDILFRVGDKKGLLTAVHSNDPAVRVADNPVSFHSFLLNYILANKKGFVADLGSASEAWFYPVYRFSMDIEELSSKQIVKCQIWYADDRVKPDYVGTVEMTAYYEYQLDLNASGEIVSGHWLPLSEDNHPKSAFFPLSPRASNPYLDYATIKQLAQSRDDELEADMPVRLTRGQHTLIALNEDEYFVDCNAGDILQLDISRIDNSAIRSHLLLSDDHGITWYDEQLDGSTQMVVTAPYACRLNLRVTREDYSDPGIYTVSCDVHSQNDLYQPSLRRGGAWNGFALVNTSAQPVTGVSVVSCDSSAAPLRTLAANLTIQPGEKRTFTVGSFAVPKHLVGKSEVLKVAGGNRLHTLFLGGDWGYNMSGFGDDHQLVSRLVIPDTSSMYDAHKAVDFGLLNRSENELTVSCELYNAAGATFGQRQVSLKPFSRQGYSESQNPFNTSFDNGWYLIEAPSAALRGYTNWRSGIENYESLPALSDFSTSFIVPHLAVGGVWNTSIVVINTNDSPDVVAFDLLQGGVYAQQSIELAPHEKRMLTLGVDLFAAVDAATLNNSALKLRATAAIVGYYRYVSARTDTRIELLAPRLAAGTLVVPHVACDNYWWTGVALLNPAAHDVVVTLTPYSASGQQLSQFSEQRTLRRQSKDVFAVSSLFSTEVLAQTAWLRIDGGDSTLYGEVLYGNRALDVVSGCALSPAE